MDLQIKPYHSEYADQVVQLWKTCNLVVPWNDPYKDIQRKVEFQSDLFYIAVLDQQVVGSIMIGYEGHRGWINYLAVDPMHQRKGYGKRLMEFAERTLLEMGCPKINLQVRDSNAEVQAFYQAIGYSFDKVVSFGKRLITDEELE